MSKRPAGSPIDNFSKRKKTNWESDSSAPLQRPRFQGTVKSHVLTNEKYTSSPLSTHQAPRNKGKAWTQENSANEEPCSNATDTGVVNSDFNTLIVQGKFKDLQIQVFSQIALTMYYTSHNMWTNPVPSLMDMPQGWPGVDTEAGLRPEHIYPQFYTIHQFPARDSLGELLHDGTLPNNNLCTAEIRNPASSRAMYGKEELTTEGNSRGDGELNTCNTPPVTPKKIFGNEAQTDWLPVGSLGDMDTSQMRRSSPDNTIMTLLHPPPSSAMEDLSQASKFQSDKRPHMNKNKALQWESRNKKQEAKPHSKPKPEWVEQIIMQMKPIRAKFSGDIDSGYDACTTSSSQEPSSTQPAPITWVPGMEDKLFFATFILIRFRFKHFALISAISPIIDDLVQSVDLPDVSYILKLSGGELKDSILKTCTVMKNYLELTSLWPNMVTREKVKNLHKMIKRWEQACG